MQPCPHCDGLGRLRHIVIGPPNTEGFLCDECDALWLRHEDISIVRLITDPQERGFHDYRMYMRNQGLDWLLDIEEIEE
jgi:hypothetical protein